MTGDALTIRLQREQAEVERLIRINALNHRAIDRYNHISWLLSPTERHTMTMTMTIGTVVRDTKWGGRYTGTIVNVEDDSIFVQWHGTCVEDELTAADVVEVAADVVNPPANGLHLLSVEVTPPAKPTPATEFLFRP